MKGFTQFLFILVALAGFTVGASAQKGGQQRPPKGDPPKIEPKDKPKPPPKGDDRPKKPGYAYVSMKQEDDGSAE